MVLLKLPFAPLQAKSRITGEEKTLTKRMEGLNVILHGTAAAVTTFVSSFEVAANVVCEDPSGQSGRPDLCWLCPSHSHVE